MNKFKLLLIFIGLLFIFWILSWFGLFNLITSSGTFDGLNFQSKNQNIETNLPSEKVSKITIDFGNGKTITSNVDVDESTTAYSALVNAAQKQEIKIKSKEYDFGILVEEIDGVRNAKDKAWVYFVNSKAGTISANKQKISQGDILEWKYIPLTQN